MTDYRDKFIKRTKEHIARVNRYASKLGHIYRYHDADKLQGALFEPYALSFKYQGFDSFSEDKCMTDEERDAYNRATIKHITAQPHHPEYFLNKADRERLESFRRDIPIMELDCTKMTDAAIMEMCCDWCAMSEEFGNTPLDWFRKTCGNVKDIKTGKELYICKGLKRWRFNDHQIELIYSLLEDL